MGIYWWLETAWLRHRSTVEAVHPLLIRLQEARGAAFMTRGRVLDVLDAKDPADLLESWLLGAPTPRPSGRTRGLGLPARLCTWHEANETCDQPVRSINAKFCEMHAMQAGRKRHRTYNGKRHGRERQSRPSAALGNQGVQKGRDPLPGILGRGRQSGVEMEPLNAAADGGHRDPVPGIGGVTRAPDRVNADGEPRPRGSSGSLNDPGG